MTPEQRKRVAELACPQYDWELSDADEVIRIESPARWYSFSPSFSDVDWQRSQALAVISYLAVRFDAVGEGLGTWFKVDRFITAIAHKDIDGLMQMVLELSLESDAKQ